MTGDDVTLPLRPFGGKIRLTALNDAVGTMLLLERPADVNFAGNGSCSVTDNVVQLTSGLLNPQLPFHTNAPTFLFCDGHVQAVKPLETMGTSVNPASPNGMWTILAGD